MEPTETSATTRPSLCRVSLTLSSVASNGGGSDNCVLLTTGGLDCWGMNMAGTLGVGTVGGPDGKFGYDLPQPVVGVAAATSVVGADGNGYSAIEGVDGVQCWGTTVTASSGTDNSEALTARTATTHPSLSTARAPTPAGLFTFGDRIVQTGDPSASRAGVVVRQSRAHSRAYLLNDCGSPPTCVPKVQPGSAQRSADRNQFVTVSANWVGSWPWNEWPMVGRDT